MELLEAQLKDRMAEVQDCVIGSDNSNTLETHPLDVERFGSMDEVGGSDSMNASPRSFSVAASQAQVRLEGNEWVWLTTNWNSLVGEAATQNDSC